MNLASDIANTGVKSRIRLYHGIARQQDAFLAFITDNVRQQAKKGKYYGDNSHRIPLENMPAFSYAHASVTERLTGNITGLCVQLMLILLFFVLSVYSFIKTEVT